MTRRGIFRQDPNRPTHTASEQMMRKGSLGVRPRRGAWEGSRQAKAVAAACFAALAFALAQPQQAAAFPCGDVTSATPPRTLSSLAPTSAASPRRFAGRSPRRARTRGGSVGGLTVFVLAIAGALLIPI